MSPIDQARNYLASVDPAISGANGHGQTYHVAALLVEGFGLSTSEARPLMLEYSARCQPPWSEREIDHKLEDADRKKDYSKVGKLIRRGVRWRMPSHTTTTARPAPTPKPAAKPARYEVSDSLELPDPMPDGARQLLRAGFQEGEGIRIAVGRLGDDGREVPKDAGVTLSREEWLRKLDAHDGNPNGFLRTSDRNGIFVSVNPMRPGGAKDSDVTAFRHALLEFDHISQIEQWGIIQASRIPCTAVIRSGGKSIHAWVRVDAETRQEFDERVKLLYAHFEDYKPDEKNKNPSRFSRLPFCERGAHRQELLALHLGCESFTEWMASVQVESLGSPITPFELEQFNPAEDPNCLLGKRWLCRGMACLIPGPSGVGKSSLNVQLACLWAMGQPAFGIVPAKPLKSLVIQAENDKGDLAEMFNGVCSGLGIEPLSDAHDLLQRNLVFIRDNTHTGMGFCENVRRLLDRHKPDLLWLDPILSFVGADLSRMEVVGQFFRNWLNPILDAAGVACFCIHHTGKPSTDKDARKHWQTSDYAYAGIGSSDLTNWARAVISLIDRGQGLFELKLAKRGKKAAVEINGSPTMSLWLRHSREDGKIFWEHADPPEQAPTSERKGGKPNDVDRVAAMNVHTFLAACVPEGEGKNQIAKRLEAWLATQNEDLSGTTCKRIIERLVGNGKLRKTADSTYVKGPNA